MYELSFREHREMPALTDYFKNETFSYYEMAKEIAKLHMLFDKAGIKQGDKIALIGRNNPRWCIAYIATLTYGACIVPILQDFTPTDYIHIINHSESRLLFLGDTYWDAIEPEDIPEIEGVFSLTDFHVIYSQESKLEKFMKNITKHYRTKYANGFRVTDIKYARVPNDQVSLLNYTSGTTGHSKGVMLTINNLTANVEYVNSALHPNGDPFFYPGSRTLSFLPLAHAYGCAIDVLTPLAAGGHITLLGKMPTPKILLTALQQVRPEIICTVPLVLDKVYRKQVLPMLEKGPMSVAVKIPLLNTVLYSVIKNKLMEAFGGNVRIFVCGGAPMNKESEAFLQKIGFPITVGYGMTECAPLISVTTNPSEFKAQSCGKYLSDYCEVKIDSPDKHNVAGEILVKGEQVMQGYYKNEAATNAVLDKDGWLHTGDMGTIDEDGTLYIRGRCKTMILTSNGQNIYPEEIEDKLNNMYLVLESLIIENNGKLHALVVPDYATADAEGVDRATLPEIMEENLKQLNALQANYEKVANITIYPIEFEKTPKKSIKRYLYNATTLKL